MKTYPHKNLYTNVHSSVINNRQKIANEIGYKSPEDKQHHVVLERNHWLDIECMGRGQGWEEGGEQ